MENYTKGEWEIKGYPSGRYIQTNELIIAQIWGQKPMAETEANAHLIASAPDLYEALKELMERFNGGVRFPLQSTCDKANEALSKAEG